MLRTYRTRRGAALAAAFSCSSPRSPSHRRPPAGTTMAARRSSIRRRSSRRRSPSASTATRTSRATCSSRPRRTSATTAQQGPEIVDDQGRPVWFHALPAGDQVWDFRTQRYRGKPVLTWWQGGSHTGAGHGEGVDYIVDDHYHVIATLKAGTGARRRRARVRAHAAGHRADHDLPRACRTTSRPSAARRTGRSSTASSRRSTSRPAGAVRVAQPRPRAAVREPVAGADLGRDAVRLLPRQRRQPRRARRPADRRAQHLDGLRRRPAHRARSTGASAARAATSRSGRASPFAWQHNPLPAGHDTIRLFDNEAAPTVRSHSRVDLDPPRPGARRPPRSSARSSIRPGCSPARRATRRRSTTATRSSAGARRAACPSSTRTARCCSTPASRPGWDTYRGYRAEWEGEPDTDPVATAQHAGAVDDRARDLERRDRASPTGACSPARTPRRSSPSRSPRGTASTPRSRSAARRPSSRWSRSTIAAARSAARRPPRRPELQPGRVPLWRGDGGTRTVVRSCITHRGLARPNARPDTELRDPRAVRIRFLDRRHGVDWIARRTCRARSTECSRATRWSAMSIPADTPAAVITLPSSTKPVDGARRRSRCPARRAGRAAASTVVVSPRRAVRRRGAAVRARGERSTPPRRRTGSRERRACAGGPRVHHGSSVSAGELTPSGPSRHDESGLERSGRARAASEQHRSGRPVPSAHETMPPGWSPSMPRERPSVSARTGRL